MQHLLHVQSADENERVEAATQQQARGVRTCKRAQPEDLKRQDRIGDPTLDQQERDEQHGCRNEHADRPRSAPAVLRCLGDSVHEEHQPAGAGERAGSVELAPHRLQPALGHDPRRR